MIGADGSEGIFIGDDVTIGRGTFIHGANHAFEKSDVPINKQGTICSKISFNNKFFSVIIENDVWIGSGVIILSGAQISQGCVIGAGTVVTKGFYPPLSVIVGNPAKISSVRAK